LLKFLSAGCALPAAGKEQEKSMQSNNASDPRSGNENNGQQQQQPQGGGAGGSGEGAASAFARMKSQHDHRARQKPADDPTHGRRSESAK
jgi:hypothetical protein